MSKIALTPNASGTGTLTIAAPNTNTDRTLTLPDATGTVNISGLANEVPAGSVGSPSIYSTGDSNTGVFFPAADTVALTTGGSERMRIDASGRVTTPYQPAFIAAGLAAQTTFTANQVIVFNTAPLNIGSGYSTSTGKFTAPVAGTYSFTYQIYLNPGNGNAPIGFFKNGTIEIFFLQGVTMSGIGLSTIISLAASDYVEVRVRNIAGASATIYQGGEHTQFTGYLLG